MAAIGAFPTLTNSLFARPKVIYTNPNTPPTSAPSVPVSRIPTSSPTSPPPNRLPTSMPRLPVPTSPPPDTHPWELPLPQQPIGVDPTPTGPTVGGTGGGTGGGETTTGTTGAGPGTGGGGGGGTDTGRLLDLLSSAFQPQEISQPYGPTSVDRVAEPSAGGTNPMAVVVLAILAIIGVVWYTQRKKRA